MATYCIGDVQGCFIELQALLNKINFKSNQDKLWFVGDLVNRGPHSLQVLQLVKSLGSNATIVLGNHDLHLLALASGVVKTKPHDTLEDILRDPDCNELCHWLRQQSLLHYDPNLNYLMVHAGIPPQWNLDNALARAAEVQTVLRSNHYPELLAHMYGDQPNVWNDQLMGWERLRMIINYFTRLRFCDETGALELKIKGKAESRPEGFLPWFKWPRHINHLKIIFGHWAALEGKTDEPHVIALDTGCVWGKCLTAMRLEDGQLFNVPCSQKLNLI